MADARTSRTLSASCNDVWWRAFRDYVKDGFGHPIGDQGTLDCLHVSGLPKLSVDRFVFDEIPLSSTPANCSTSDAVASVPYRRTLAGPTAGTPPFTWQVTSGSLPNGLTLDSATGLISGTPSVARCFDTSVGGNCVTVTSAFTVQVTDSRGQTTTLSERIRVLPSTVCTAGCSLQVTLAGDELFRDVPRATSMWMDTRRQQ